jgi:MSHA biogenesis protein MshP
MSATFPDVLFDRPFGQAGFALPAAIFILVALAVLAVFLLATSNLQHGGSTLDVQGARAYQAARAGIEWGTYRALRDGSCVPAASLALPGGLSGFTATVQCAQSTYTEAGSPVDIFLITSTACNQPSAGNCPGLRGQYYVERQLQATVSR